MAKPGQNQELDLTPFIGLFAMLVVLLLVTASWNRLYSFKTEFSKKADGPSPRAVAQEPEDKEKTLTTKIQVMSNKIDFVEEKEERNVASVPMSNLQWDTRRVMQLGENWVQRHGKDQQVTIETVAAFPYGKLIELYDNLIQAGVVVLAISTENLEEGQEATQ